ncbi:MAG: arginase family protein [Cytophagales bacterium]
MDLKIFFDPLVETDFDYIKSPLSWKENISINFGNIPNWKEAQIAIVGIAESRGNSQNESAEKGANAIRKKLFELKKGFGSYQIVDLGNLRCGVKVEDTYLRVKEVCEILLEFNTMPILIGGTHDIDLGLYYAFEKFNKFVSVLNIDSELDMYPDAENQCQSHTHRILVHEPNYLFHFANLAYQSYLNDPSLIDVLERLYFENIRLGLLRENIKEVEPIIRMADLMSFDISAVKMQDAPGHPSVRPFGLTG